LGRISGSAGLSGRIFFLPDIQPNHPAGFLILPDIRLDNPAYPAGSGRHLTSGIRQEILDPAQPYL